MTARCFGDRRGQKNDTGDAAAVPGAFGNTLCHGPRQFGAAGLPSVGRHSRGVTTMDGSSHE
jgi:hypothetical protein